MTKNRALVTGRSPVRDSLGALLLSLVVLVLVLVGGCTAARTSTSFHQASGLWEPAGLRAPGEERGGEGAAQGPEAPPASGCATPPPGWPDLSSSEAEELLAPFLSCTSPAGFVRLQRRVDMARLVGRLDEWSAVRLGALGPLLPQAAGVLNRKRADFLVTASREYGVALGEVFALFVIHSSFDRDLEKVLRQLAQEKRLGQTLGKMAVAREQLRRRGLHLSDYPERPERPGDGLRGAREGMGEVVSSSPCFRWANPWVTKRARGSCHRRTGRPWRRWRARWWSSRCRPVTWRWGCWTS